MFKDARAYSGFSVDDIDTAKRFYGETLGVDVEEANGMLTLRLGGGANVLVYPKENHEPATFTILNFPVREIESAVDALVAKGVEFEHYGGEYSTDAKGIMRAWGPPIAWFRDPAGNVLAVIEAETA